MNAKSLFTALASVAALAAAGSAFAQEATPDTWVQSAKSQVSRAEVQAQAVAAKAAGHIGHGEVTHFNDAKTMQLPALSRTQVAAEAREATRLGLTQAGEGQARDATANELAAIRAAGQRAG